jgi:uncharacterized protein with HEPN domain
VTVNREHVLAKPRGQRKRTEREYGLRMIGVAGRTSFDVRAVLADVPWERIIGMRNRLAHGYDGMSLDVVVDTVGTRLPKLAAELRKALKGKPE